MVENQWVVSIEKTVDGQYVMNFKGTLYLKISSLIAILIGLGTIFVTVQHYFAR